MSEENKVVEKPSLFGMIFSPTEQFHRIKEKPLIWGAMFIVSILTAIGTYFMAMGVDMSEFENLPGMEVFTQVTYGITGLFTPIFSVLITSFIHWIIVKIARSETTFKQLFSMNTYIMLIYALGTLLNGILTPLLDGDGKTMFTSLASIIDAEGAVLGLFQSLEVFAIWGSVILTAFGLHIVGNLSKRAAWIVSITIYVISTLLLMIGTALGTMAGV